MKKKTLFIGSIAFLQFFALRAQEKKQLASDSLHSKVDEDKISVVYNHYTQNGNNSAVTGGIGTELLTIYGPSVRLRKAKGSNALSMKLGADIISSASTDKIDTIPSSASSLDGRLYYSLGYQKDSMDKRSNVGLGYDFSIESDYTSHGFRFNYLKNINNSHANINWQFSVYLDDLRWGRFNKGLLKPVRLVYPIELRNKNWLDQYSRNSYNLNVSYDQIINKRTLLGVFADLSFQQGLLSTPFHRVYLIDGTPVVENLPSIRKRIGAGIKVNKFLFGDIILKNQAGVYWDSFSINGINYSLEAIYKVNMLLSFFSRISYYSQNSSRYFKPYGEHDSKEKFYTSDYDLSAFQRYGIGAGIRWIPNHLLSRRKYLQNINFRYNYHYRTNGLSSHALTLELITVKR